MKFLAPSVAFSVCKKTTKVKNLKFSVFSLFMSKQSFICCYIVCMTVPVAISNLQMLLFWYSVDSSHQAFTWSEKIFNRDSRNSRTRCKICSKLSIKTPKQYHWCHSCVFIVSFEHISLIVLTFLLVTLSR